MKITIGLLFLLTGCAGAYARTPHLSAPPPLLLGAFRDDYGSSYQISDTLFAHLPRARYRIREWHPAEQFFIAENDSANPGEPGRWTRVDWMRLDGQGPWLWAFCLTAWNATDAGTARATPPANRQTPLTGCSGYPFTRMRALPAETPTALSLSEVIGCHVVQIGSWSELIEVPPPDTVWLFPDTVRTPGGTTAYRLEPSMPLTFRRLNQQSWQLVDGEVRLSWGSEFHGATMQVFRKDTEMVGSASFWRHVLRLVEPPRRDGRARLAPNPVADVVLRRCT